jgi:hypothetical protein
LDHTQDLWWGHSTIRSSAALGSWCSSHSEREINLILR